MDGAAVETHLRDYFARQPDGNVAAYLFGSFGRGTAGPGSDVDVAVLYSEGPPSTLESPALALEGDVERLLGRRSQIVVLNSAPVDLVHRVLRDGRLVFEGDRSARIAFEVRSRNDYFDLLPYLRRDRKLERPAG
jgi:predicted nucleotidyltransferase